MSLNLLLKQGDEDGAEEEGTDGVAEKELLRVKYVYNEGKITKELYSDYFFNGEKTSNGEQTL